MHVIRFISFFAAAAVVRAQEVSAVTMITLTRLSYKFHQSGSLQSTSGTTFTGLFPSVSLNGTYDGGLGTWSSTSAEISYVSIPSGDYPFSGFVSLGEVGDLEFESGAEGNFVITASLGPSITPLVVEVFGNITFTPEE